MIALWAMLAWGADKVVVEPPAQIGVESEIRVEDEDGLPRPGRTVRVTYRVGLSNAEDRAIGITDGLGRVRWTPEMAGAAEVSIDGERQPLSIAWGAPPASVLAILVVLLATIVGFVGFGLSSGRRWAPGRSE